jgi:amino acid adenylation domain-containing protein
MTDKFPLTFTQQSMVAASLRAPERGVYLMQDVCETAELLDSTCMAGAWDTVSRRHEALRLTITPTADGFEQTLAEYSEHTWREIDWSDMQPAAARVRLMKFLREDRRRGVEFDAGPPMRLQLIRFPCAASVMVWTVHHAVTDGRSNHIVWTDLFSAYDALIVGRGPTLTAATGFVEHLHFLDRFDAAAAAEYWRGRFAGVTQTTGFIVDRLKASGAAPTGVQRKTTLRLSSELSDELRQFAKAQGVTVHTLIQGAWALLMSRCSGAEDVIFGEIRAGRRVSVPGAENIVGPLVNTLPIRVIAEPHITVAEWLARLRQEAIGRRAFEQTNPRTAWSQGGGPATPRLFDAAMVYERSSPGDALRALGGNWNTRRICRLQRTDVPLTLAAYAFPCVELNLIYDAGVFSRPTMAGLTDCLGAILESFVRNANAPLSTLSLVPEQKRRALISAHDRTRTDLCADGFVHQLVDEQARRGPHRVALEQGGRAITYRELIGRASAGTRLLQGAGLTAGCRVAVVMRRTPEAVIGILAVLKAGCVFAALDPDLPHERRTGMLDDYQPDAVLVDADSNAAIAIGRTQVLRLDPASHADSVERPEVVSADAAYAVFTSGSTGRPKAVLVSHRSFANHTLAAAKVFDIRDSDRRLQFAPIGSDVFIAEVFNYLACGAALVFPAQDRITISTFADVLDSARITIAGMPAAWWLEWVKEIKARRSFLPVFLRAVITGMESVSAEAASEWRDLAPSIRLFNAYGPAETTMTATVYENGTSPWQTRRRFPIGTPLTNVCVYVLDKDGRHAPDGIAGELTIGGAGVARGYLNAPDLTAAKYIDDPHCKEPGGRMYRTGDIGFRLPDGNLAFLGRIDRQVKIRGHRIELGEIEARLAACAGVSECAVVLDSRSTGPVLIAYVVAENAPVSAAALRAQMRLSLPPHMIPHTFAAVTAIPKTRAGKIDYAALVSYEPCTPLESCSRELPRTRTESEVSGVWSEILGSGDFGIHDDFFDSGGDSLRASALVRAIEHRFRRPLPAWTVLRFPTIAGMAAYLDGAPVKSDDLVALRSEGSRPPMFCVTWAPDDPYCFRTLSYHLGDDQPLYSISNPLTPRDTFVSVEELAERTARLISRERPHGPYILGGFCFGGLVALEAARRLVKAGEEVRLTILFDTATPDGLTLPYARAQYWRRAYQFRREFRSRALSVRNGDLADHIRFLGKISLGWVNRAALRAVSAAGASALIPPSHGIGPLMRRSIYSYRPQRFDFPIVQFLAADEPITTRVLEDPRLEWNRLCADLRVFPIPGDHSTLLSGAGAQSMAEILCDLTAADQKTGRHEFR